MNTTTPFWLVIAAARSMAIAPNSNAEGEDFVREAGAKFQRNCMGCHTPPDLRFATDRAWLGQIRRTV